MPAENGLSLRLDLNNLTPAPAKEESMAEPQKPPAPPAEKAEGEPVIDARVLLQGRREVWIEHAGVRYRLRLTRRNKLILQK
jgi:hemin uptake protein HemP